MKQHHLLCFKLSTVQVHNENEVKLLKCFVTISHLTHFNNNFVQQYIFKANILVYFIAGY